MPELANVLLDEGVPKSVSRVLLAAGYDAKRVHDLGPRGMSNGAVLRLASSSGRILLTRDADFLKLAPSSERVPKIVYLEAYPDEPEKLAAHVESFFGNCLRLLSTCYIVILREQGPECLGH